VTASEIETGTVIGTETETGRGGKERLALPWPFHRALFSRMSVNAIVWKPRCIIATVIVTVEELAHIILHSLPPRPHYHQYVNRVHACL
jgi:hypothetical protein